MAFREPHLYLADYPFEVVTEEEYKTALFDHPAIDWSKFNVDEHEDKTTGSQELACSGSNCEVF